MIQELEQVLWLQSIHLLNFFRFRRTGLCAPSPNAEGKPLWTGGLTKWPPAAFSNIKYLVILWFKGSFCVLELTERLIQWMKEFNRTYANIQINNIKEKINPVDFTSRHNIFRITYRLKAKRKHIQNQKKCHHKWKIVSWSPEKSNQNM